MGRMRKAMNKKIPTIAAAAVLFFGALVGPAAAQDSGKIVADGVVVAYQKNNRCPSCKGSISFGVQIENWIVRVDHWRDEKFAGNKYILVKYQIYDRSLSEVEIDSELRFALRERKDYETNHDCVGNIAYREGNEYFLRPAEFTDYALTEPGLGERIPRDLKSLPCFIVEKLPILLKQDRPEPGLLSSLPPANAARLIERLNLFVEYERTKQWGKFFALLYRPKTDKEAHSKARKEYVDRLNDPDDPFDIQRIAFIPKMIDPAFELEENTYMVRGCATYNFKGRINMQNDIIMAHLIDDDWYFSGFGEVAPGDDLCR